MPADDGQIEPMSQPAPSWLRGVFPDESIASAARLGWGFRNETWRVDLKDGRRVVAAGLADPDRAADLIVLTRLLQPRLGAVGLPVPSLVELASQPTGVVVTEFVDGVAGAALLNRSGGAALIGSLLGTIWHRLASIDTAGLPLATDWTDGRSLAETSLRRLADLEPRLRPAERDRMEMKIRGLPDLLAGRPPAFVHGDLLPVNIIVRDDRLAALVDFEFARLADPLLDASWLVSILTFHHPASEQELWAAFTAAADLRPEEVRTHRLLEVLPVVRYLEILAAPRITAKQSRRWLTMLQAHLARTA